jgi:hypothetical protein
MYSIKYYLYEIISWLYNENCFGDGEWLKW